MCIKLYIQNKLIKVTNVFSTKSLHVQLLALVPLRDRRASDIAHLAVFRYCEKMFLELKVAAVWSLSKWTPKSPS